MHRSHVARFAFPAFLAVTGFTAFCSGGCTKTEGTSSGASTSTASTSTAAPSASASAATTAFAAPSAAASDSAGTAASATPSATASGATSAAATGSAAPKASGSAGTAAAANSAANAECGTKPQPDCPLQAWMKANTNPPIAANDLPALATALDKTATFAPPGYGNWATIAKDGAKAARGGDMTAAKASCRTCHDQYKQKYKTELRGRKI